MANQIAMARSTKTATVWVVEESPYGENNYEPVRVRTTRDEAREVRNSLSEDFPTMKFRVSKYVREDRDY